MKEDLSNKAAFKKELCAISTSSVNLASRYDRRDSYSNYSLMSREKDFEMWDNDKEESKVASRLIMILAFFIIFAMLFVIIISLRMSDMIDEKGTICFSY